MQNILVTGSAGFIGANLVMRLLKTEKDINIVGLDNLNDYYDVSLKEFRLKEIDTIYSQLNHSPQTLNSKPSTLNYKFIKGSIADKTLVDQLFAENHFDIVVNLAAQAGVRYSIENPDAYIQSNIIGFYNILEACRHAKELVEENGLDYKDLKLEVTESAYTDNASQLLDVVHRLREMGFEIEMDDFGSGYSSLNMISAMPLDVLKMDMKFIKNIEHNAKDFRLVELVMDIAKYLKVPVVAEGVETENQMRLLKEADCDLVQGYYFSRPLPPEDFEKLIERELEIIRGTQA